MVFIRALFGAPLSPDELEVFRQHTGREAPPRDPVREAWAIVGRRGGKSRVAGTLAVHLATARDYRPYLAPGERATIMVIAKDRNQARSIFRYVVGTLSSDRSLACRVEGEPRSDSVDLQGQVTIEVHTSSGKSVRGYTIAAALLDEVAFWPTDDAAEPDYEILNAIRPGMATIPGAVLFGMSSPYARKGVLWQMYREHFGKDSPVLVWKADTLSMNPSIDPELIRRAYEDDEVAADAEYGANFRRDVEGFIAKEILDAVTVVGRHELPPVPGVRYVGFVDPSGGSSDSMTLAVGHLETHDGSRKVVLDCLRERQPPFSPDNVVREFCEVLSSYGIRTVKGDRYGGEWCREPFRRRGIRYELASMPKSDMYVNMLPLLNSAQVELLDNKRLRSQLMGLERRTSRGGRDSIDHAPMGHDDVANAAAGVIVELGTKLSSVNPLDHIG